MKGPVFLHPWCKVKKGYVAKIGYWSVHKSYWLLDNNFYNFDNSPHFYNNFYNFGNSPFDNFSLINQEWKLKILRFFRYCKIQKYRIRFICLIPSISNHSIFQLIKNGYIFFSIVFTELRKLGSVGIVTYNVMQFFVIDYFSSIWHLFSPPEASDSL